MNYKDGRTLKIYYCIKCSKQISVDIFLYGSKLCGSCGKKGRTVSVQTKEKISISLKGRKRPKISKQMLGAGNHQYKGKTNFCNNCGKQLKNNKAKFCWDCYCSLNLNKGENAPNYINGESQQKYSSEFTPSLKYKIRTRDNFECQNCNMTEEEHLSVYGFCLEVHHIDYDKENNKETNLITLCKQCNIRANYNRKEWQTLFTTKNKQINIFKER